MTENLKIEFFKNSVQDLITNLDIPVGACFFNNERFNPSVRKFISAASSERI